jgi:eukaryotic-like serine/threonine-protein kinase
MTTWNPRANDLFLKALELRSTGERQEFLDGACAADTAFRAEVEALLEASDKAGSFLQSSAPLLGATIDAPAPDERPGTVIGPYKLLQQIGEGGMGTVFMAEQSHPVQRKVALKVIKRGMDSRQVIARFEAERQALAMMDHVNIARVLDAGATEAGRPYFVMELVHGMPITKYCDDNHLSPRERLELFVPVCHAIQHAHQKGIIHRDIKPSNVMITLYDGKPVAKVIDFGVAKATEQKLTERTLFTQYGTMVGTLEYMSPEQAEMSALGIDTRSDIYSLGVLLYELLTGGTPLSHKRLKEAAHAEILRMIREEEPPKPSTRLSDSGEALASISANRHMEPAKLTKLVRGDLDWIVMKCLEKDRNRRYETANGFAMDVQRYLADEPVQACPPSTGYRLRKFVRRNRGSVLAAGLVLLAVIAGVIGTSISTALLWREEERTRTAFERAEANLVLALKALDQIYVDEAEGHPKIREGLPHDLLKRGLGFYEEFARENAHNQDVSFLMGRANYRASLIFRELGQEDRANEALDRAISNYREAIRLEPDLAAAHGNLGIALLHKGDPDGAIASACEAIRLKPDFAEAHCSLGCSLRANGDMDGAIREFREAIRLKPDYAEGHGILGNALLDKGDPDGAIASCREAIRLKPDLAKAHCNLGDSLLEKGEPDGAIASYREAIRLKPDYHDAHYNLGKALLRKGDPDGAIASHREALRLKPSDAVGHFGLGNALMRKGDSDGAIASFREAIRLKPDYAEAHGNLGSVLFAKGDSDGAIASFRETIRFKPGDALGHHNLGNALLRKGDPDGAIASCREAIRLKRDDADAHYDLGSALLRKGDPDGAIASYREAIRLKPDDADAHYDLGSALLRKGDPDGAIASYREAIRLKPDYVEAHGNLGGVLFAKGDPDGAIASLREAIRLEPDDAKAHCNLGSVLLAKGDPDGAIASCREAIRLEPDDAKAHCNLGNALVSKGDPDGAIASYREAIRLKPDYAEAHCNLGHALLNQARFSEALPWLRKGHELGSMRPDWHYPSGEWIESAERKAEMEGRLDQVLSGGERPRDAVERVAFAELLYAKSRHAESARMYAEAFAEDAALAGDLVTGHRYNAACSAGLAAASGGADAAEWRGRALEWLRADLAAHEKAQSGLVATLEHWKQDPDLAAVRERLDELPKPEREAWRSLWAAVDRALAAARPAAK